MDFSFKWAQDFSHVKKKKKKVKGDNSDKGQSKVVVS